MTSSKSSNVSSCVVAKNPPNEQLKVRRNSLANTTCETIVALEMNIERENRLKESAAPDRQIEGPRIQTPKDYPQLGIGKFWSDVLNREDMIDEIKETLVAFGDRQHLPDAISRPDHRAQENAVD